MNCISGYKPEIWSNVDHLMETYQHHVGRMRTRSCLSAMDYNERLYAVFSHAAYRFTTPNPIERINEYTLVVEHSDENSVVYSTEAVLGVTTRVVIAFRGTNPLRLDDIITDVALTFGRETETRRFALAMDKVDRVMDLYPEVPITVCGHSLGGTQAIYVSKKHRLRAYTYNPAQGICMRYLEEIDQHPQIHVCRVISDPVSCIAGLENVDGTVLFPQVSSKNMVKNHSLYNFLPSRNLPSLIDI